MNRSRRSRQPLRRQCTAKLPDGSRCREWASTRRVWVEDGGGGGFEQLVELAVCFHHEPRPDKPKPKPLPPPARPNVLGASPPPIVVLNECLTLMVDCRARYRLALDRLQGDAAPGFADRTPGNGDPPGGRGARVTAPGEDDSVGPDAYTITERLALSPLPELAELDAVRYGPARVLVRLLHLLGHLGVDTEEHPAGLDDQIANLHWSIRYLRALVRRPQLVDRAPPSKCRNLYKAVTRLHEVVVRWGYIPAEPEGAAKLTEALAEDPTERWCRSCLRAGSRWPRYRGDLCRWCYEFQGAEGFLPPPEIIVARSQGKKITEQMVAPHRQRHRDRQRQQRQLERTAR